LRASHVYKSMKAFWK